MKPVTQTKAGGPKAPPEERGDCWPACLASLLEVAIESVAVSHTAEHWWVATQRALEPHGYHAVVADPSIYPDGYWIAAVPSRNLGTYEDGRPVQHVIVMCDGEVAHDPALSNPWPAGTSIEELDVREAFVLVPFEIRSVAA